MFDHTTSRKCDDPSCNGQLKDSIINFGENLPETELRNAFDHAGKVSPQTYILNIDVNVTFVTG